MYDVHGEFSKGGGILCLRRAPAAPCHGAWQTAGLQRDVRHPWLPHTAAAPATYSAPAAAATATASVAPAALRVFGNACSFKYEVRKSIPYIKYYGNIVIRGYY